MTAVTERKRRREGAPTAPKIAPPSSRPPLGSETAFQLYGFVPRDEQLELVRLRNQRPTGPYRFPYDPDSLLCANWQTCCHSTCIQIRFYSSRTCYLCERKIAYSAYSKVGYDYAHWICQELIEEYLERERHMAAYERFLYVLASTVGSWAIYHRGRGSQLGARNYELVQLVELRDNTIVVRAYKHSNISFVAPKNVCIDIASIELVMRDSNITWDDLRADLASELQLEDLLSGPSD